MSTDVNNISYAKNALYIDKILTYSHYYLDTPKQSDYHKHAHNCYELLYFISGDANYYVENFMFKLEKYDLIFIKPKNFHYLALNDSSISYERIHFTFDSSFLSASELDEMFSTNHKISLAGDKFFQDWSKRIEYDIRHYQGEDKRRSVYLLITEFLIYLKNHKEIESDLVISNSILSKAIEYINDNISTVKTAQEVANAVYISTSYLHYLFKKYLSVGPKDYIMEKKLLKAEEYITQGYNLYNVSSELNFENYSSFYRAFKKHFGYSPSDKHKQ